MSFGFKLIFGPRVGVSWGKFRTENLSFTSIVGVDRRVDNIIYLFYSNIHSLANISKLWLQLKIFGTQLI